jgi:hypothetical protein
MAKLVLHKNPGLVKSELERHQQFLQMTPTDRFLFTCHLIAFSRLMGGKPKQPSGKGLIIKKQR